MLRIAIEKNRIKSSAALRSAVSNFYIKSLHQITVYITIIKDKCKRMIKKLTDSKWTGPILAVLGLAVMGFGIYRGEVSVVFTKAINICMECIGIG